MSQPDRLEVFRPFGVQFSDNIFAAQLEERLGIDFPNKPGMVERNPRNVAFLGLNALVSTESRALLWSMYNLLDSNTPASYSARYHLIFIKSNLVAPILGWHENTHGWINSRNSALRPQYQVPGVRELLNNAGQAVAEASKQASSLFFKKVLHEGFAEWVSITLGLESGDEQLAEKARQRNNSLLIKSAEKGLVTSKAAVEPIFRIANKHLQHIAAPLDLRSRDENAIKQVRALTEEMKGLFFGTDVYHLGYYFALGYMQLAAQGGLTTAKALELSVMNPPTRLADFRNPQDYLQRIANLGNVARPAKRKKHGKGSF